MGNEPLGYPRVEGAYIVMGQGGPWLCTDGVVRSKDFPSDVHGAWGCPFFNNNEEAQKFLDKYLEDNTSDADLGQYDVDYPDFVFEEPKEPWCTNL